MPSSGDAVLWYYPVSSGSRATLETITLGTARISDVIEEATPSRTEAIGYEGDRATVWDGAGLSVTIRAERWLGYKGASTATLRRQLETLQSHLDRGGIVGVTVDYAKAWCASSSSATPRGGTLIYHDASAFNAWSPSAALADGDEVWIEHGSPNYERESHTVSGAVSASSTQTTLGEAQVYEPAAGAARWVRWRYFWPALYQPNAGTPALRHELGQRVWSLELSLSLDYATMSALLGSGSTPGARPLLTGATTGSMAATSTLDAYRSRTATSRSAYTAPSAARLSFGGLPDAR